MSTDVEREPIGDQVISQRGSARRRGGRPWLIVAMCMLFMVLNFADKSVLGFAGADIKRDLDISASQFGLLQSAFFWLFAAGAILITALTTRISAAAILGVLVVVWTLTLIPLTITSSFTLVLVCRVILGFAEGPAIGLAMAVAHSWVPADKRAFASGVVNAGSSLGPLIAAPILTWTIATHSWHAGFLVLIPVALIWFVAWLFIGGMGSQGAAEGNRNELPTLPERVPWLRLLTQPTIIGIALLTFLAYCCVALKISWLPLYLEEGLGYTPSQVGFLATLPYTVAIAANFGFGWLSSRLSARGVTSKYARGWLSIGLVLGNGLSMVLFAIMDAGPAQMVFVALGFALYSAAVSISFATLSDVVPPTQRGTVFGGIIAFYSLGGILAPLFMGHVVDAAATAADGYALGFLSVGILMSVGSVLVLALIRPERDAARLVRLAEADAVQAGRA